MKRQNIIIILWFLWIASIIAIFFGVYKYINQKKISLRSELKDNIQALFQGQSNGDAFVGNDDGFFYTEYCNYPVRHYKKVSKPPRPKFDKSSNIGIVPCKEANRSFVEYVMQDYDKPMEVATYTTSKEMLEMLKDALPDMD